MADAVIGCERSSFHTVSLTLYVLILISCPGNSRFILKGMHFYDYMLLLLISSLNTMAHLLWVLPAAIRLNVNWDFSCQWSSFLDEKWGKIKCNEIKLLLVHEKEVPLGYQEGVLKTNLLFRIWYQKGESSAVLMGAIKVNTHLTKARWLVRLGWKWYLLSPCPFLLLA